MSTCFYCALFLSLTTQLLQAVQDRWLKNRKINYVTRPLELGDCVIMDLINAVNDCGGLVSITFPFVWNVVECSDQIICLKKSGRLDNKHPYAEPGKAFLYNYSYICGMIRASEYTLASTKYTTLLFMYLPSADNLIAFLNTWRKISSYYIGLSFSLLLYINIECRLLQLTSLKGNIFWRSS